MAHTDPLMNRVASDWLEQTSTGTAACESLWMFLVIETVHIFGIFSLVGSSSILDLRFFGRDIPRRTSIKALEAVFTLGLSGLRGPSRHWIIDVCDRSHENVLRPSFRYQD